MARVIHSVLLLHSFPSLFNSAFSAYVLNGFWRGSQIAFHWPAPADNVTDQRLVNWHIPCLLTVSAYHKNYREEFSSTSGSSLQMLSKLPFTISHVARDGSQSTFFFFFNFYFVLGYNQLTKNKSEQIELHQTKSFCTEKETVHKTKRKPNGRIYFQIIQLVKFHSQLI